MDRWLRSGLWWLPLLFAGIVAGVGAYTYRTLEDASRESLRSGLETILDAEVAALQLWVTAQKEITQVAALDPEVREAAAALVEIRARAGSETGAEELRRAPAAAGLVQAVEPVVRSRRFVRFALLARDGIVLAATQPSNVGRRLPIDPLRFEAILAGRTILSPPQPPVWSGAERPADEARAVILTGTPGPDGRTAGRWSCSASRSTPRATSPR